ncbi:nickel pincer cofactor biosynthesis protein LarC [Clostridium rectalis]|uniref:nickel pincer cofactor biosynthesis protein LarC n=1 Tax=Clostridium rectalis TaxID=2040295 RepID=UPI000F643366|nr:nickel pincer cofactor biosynthesis protein LarC [Clostridium rectalis]
MKVIYYDCFSGISGDMNLGAMIDLGVKKEYLINELSKLNLQDEFSIKVNRGGIKGITGTKVNVILHNNSENKHCHRNLNDIRDIIYNSDLNEDVKKLSMDIFMKVARAESKVHGKELKEVHFHEVGAIDSIIDIVGAAICANFLKVDKVLFSPLELGKGFIKCAHGTLPVPAPATWEILKDIPVKLGNIPFEATTPTGAAIAVTLADEFQDKCEFVVKKIGYGIGSNNKGDIPNVLRVVLGCIDIKKELYIMECNIDDMSSEMYPYVMDVLFEKGAIDVYLTSIFMKKGRPGIMISILYEHEFEDEIKNTLFKETSTIGIRKYKIDRFCLNRETINLKTTYGNINVKKSYLNDGNVKYKPEYEDMKRVSKSEGIPLIQLYDYITKLLKNV